MKLFTFLHVCFLVVVHLVYFTSCGDDCYVVSILRLHISILFWLLWIPIVHHWGIPCSFQCIDHGALQSIVRIVHWWFGSSQFYFGVGLMFGSRMGDLWNWVYLWHQHQVAVLLFGLNMGWKYVSKLPLNNFITEFWCCNMIEDKQFSYLYYFTFHIIILAINYNSFLCSHTYTQ